MHIKAHFLAYLLDFIWPWQNCRRKPAVLRTHGLCLSVGGERNFLIPLLLDVLLSSLPTLPGMHFSRVESPAAIPERAPTTLLPGKELGHVGITARAAAGLGLPAAPRREQPWCQGMIYIFSHLWGEPGFVLFMARKFGPCSLKV